MKRFLVAAVLAGTALAGGGSANASHCFEEFPPDPLCDWIHDQACPAFASLSPGLPGLVDVDSEGDVSVAGTPFYDCPPYGS